MGTVPFHRANHSRGLTCMGSGQIVKSNMYAKQNLEHYSHANPLFSESCPQTSRKRGVQMRQEILADLELSALCALVRMRTSRR